MGGCIKISVVVQRKKPTPESKKCVFAQSTIFTLWFSKKTSVTPLASGSRRVRDVWLNLSRRGRERLSDHNQRDTCWDYPEGPAHMGWITALCERLWEPRCAPALWLAPAVWLAVCISGPFYAATVPLLHRPATLVCRCCGWRGGTRNTPHPPDGK